MPMVNPNTPDAAAETAAKLIEANLQPLRFAYADRQDEIWYLVTTCDPLVRKSVSDAIEQLRVNGLLVQNPRNETLIQVRHA